jgi:tetratricopeptide (TPR) repeat protein
MALCAAAFGRAPVAQAITQLRRGMECPPLALKGRGGAEVTTAGLRGRAAVLIFGEVYHEKTRQAWEAISVVLQDERLASEGIIPVLIATRDGEDEERKPFFKGRVMPVLVSDSDRRTFEQFQVVVIPSVVIVGRDGHIVHVVAGLMPRLADIISDSLLFACGKLSEERLSRSIASVPTTQASENDIRADRLAHLASQLAHRGLNDLAAEKYRETLALNARHPEARLGLATLLLNQRHLPEAEAEFRAVLAANPESLDALLGLAYVQTLRGGPELDQAEIVVRAILARSPSHARAHYLLGLISEKRNKPEDAAANFKKASEILLDHADQE